MELPVNQINPADCGRSRDRNQEPITVGGILCMQCGDCCRTMGSPPWLMDDEELTKLPPEIATVIRFFLQDSYRYDAGLPCYFLDSANKCLIYEYRPTECREFEPGCEACSLTKKEKIMELTQQELQEIIEKAERASKDVGNPHWIRAWQRLSDAALAVERLIEGSTTKK